MRHAGERQLGVAVVTSAVKDMGMGSAQEQWTAYHFLTAASASDASMLEFWCAVAKLDRAWVREWAMQRSLAEWQRWWRERSSQQWRAELTHRPRAR